MNRLFVGNFDFEHRLAGRRGSELPEPIRRINDELAVSWVAIAEDGDFIFAGPEIEPGFFSSLHERGLADVQPVSSFDDVTGPVELCPWGWTTDLLQTAERHAFQTAAPNCEIVKKLNSRRFSFKLESDWGVGLAGATAVGTLAELSRSLTAIRPAQRWVLKAEFGMSARERVLGTGPTLNESTGNWAATRLQRDGVLFFEPWVVNIAEAGLQFDVPADGPPVLLGVTPLSSDRSGQYLASRFTNDPSLETTWAPAIETGLRVCRRARKLGYFGPLGIDAMRYAGGDGNGGDGGESIRPLQDINARWTMGRLSLGFRRLLCPGETGEWRHVTWPIDAPESPQQAYNQFVAELPPTTRALRTAPFQINNHPVRHGSVVVVESRVESPESRVQSPESRVQSPESRVQS